MEKQTESTQRRWSAGPWLGLVAVIASVTGWFYGKAPMFGHDLLAGVFAVHELRDAWERFGVFAVEFSPLRCFGQPVLASPNGAVYSLFHIASLVWADELTVLFVVPLLMVLLGFLGVSRLSRDLGLSRGPSTVLAVGWSLQGWLLGRVSCGHGGLVALALMPLILWLSLQRKPRWWQLGALAFLLAQMVYGAGYYILILVVPAMLLSLVVLRQMALPETGDGVAIGSWKQLSRNLLIAGPLAVVMALPKLLATREFSALYPREASFDHLPFGTALSYALNIFVNPFPVSYRETMRGYYNDWETVAYILPGAVWALGLLLWHRRGQVAWRRPLVAFGLLVVVATVLTWGVLAPVFSALPLIKSLHVNTRLTAVVLLPYLVLVMATLRMLARSGGVPVAALAGLALVWVAAPVMHGNALDFAQLYPRDAGIDRERHVALQCYEPIFGYRLEAMPPDVRAALATNPRAELPVDPRCYLRSGQCTPGSRFDRTTPAGAADAEAMRRYALRDPTTSVQRTTPVALVLMLGGLLALVWAIARLVRSELGPDELPAAAPLTPALDDKPGRRRRSR